MKSNLTYQELISQESDFSFDTMMRLSALTLPEEKKQYPWLGLSHGIKILENETELAQYNCAYGHMHKAKIDAALNTIEDTEEFLKNELTLIDWGCGQALATICFFDYMRKLGKEPRINRIILIEPSKIAVDRAAINIGKIIKEEKIVILNKYINDIQEEDIETSNGTVLHFFSNILDIPSVNLEHLFTVINKGTQANQLFFCIGPQNIGASRIEYFAKQFNLSEEEYIEKQSGKLAIRGTINMLVFRRKGNDTQIIKVEFLHRHQINIENDLALRRILEDIPTLNNLEQKVLLFYKSVIELERKKSVKAILNYDYPIHEDFDENHHIRFNIDIQDNPDFEVEFAKNFDKSFNKWPRNLNVGISVAYEGKQYRLLQYIYPHEDLKKFDFKTQFITVDIAAFSFNHEITEELGISNDIVTAIEFLIKRGDCNIDKLETILKDAISNELVINHQLQLALTNEEIALAQILSELKSLYDMQYSDLLNCILKGELNNNIVDEINPDTLIHVNNIDTSQRRAIATALNSKVAVVTGPPGTGKTQMILNLIANAAVRGKSILVASKNNKAVDNIKTRYDEVEPYNLLLRFGSRDAIKNQTIPYLEGLLVKIPNIIFDQTSFEKRVSEYQNDCQSITDCQKSINKYIQLKDKLVEHEYLLKKLKEDIVKIENESIEEEKKLLNLYKDIIPYLQDNSNYNWDNIQKEYKKYINILQTKTTGIERIIFLLFQKKKYARDILNKNLTLPTSLSERLNIEANINDVSDVKDASQLIAICKSAVKQIGRLIEFLIKQEKIKKDFNNHSQTINEEISKEKAKLTQNQKEYNDLESQYDQLINTITRSKENIDINGIALFKENVLSKLLMNQSTYHITCYKNYLPDRIPWKKEEVDQYKTDAQLFLKIFRLNSVTNLSVKNAYPLSKELFDLVIIDEASQCDVASALPLIQRAKQLVVIGDPLQLRHITSITVDEEEAIKDKLRINEKSLVQYANKSLWDYCNELITSTNSQSRPVILDCHYRCHPQIIGYSNERFYKRRLGINLNIHPNERHPELESKGIIWEDVKGVQKNEFQNINEDEVKKCVEIAIKLAEEYPTIDIGIISPFKHQIQQISAHLRNRYENRITVDTVHGFQGDERDVIIYSLVVTDNSKESKIRWIDYSVPNLVNVAVTRARTALYIVGNKEYIRNKSKLSLPLGALLDYVENKNVIRTEHETFTYIIDSNIFVHCPDVLDKINSRDYIVIPSKVIDELDKLKVTLTGNEKQNVEQALRNINHTSGKIRIECADLHYLPNDFNKKSPDNLILSVAIKYKNQNPILLTSDNGLQIKAKGLGIKTMSINTFLTK